MINNNFYKYEYVSFDMFDTLVKRVLLNSKNVFWCVSNKYRLRTGIYLDDFVEKRSQVEHDLWKNTNDGLFTLNEIYNRLALYYSEDTCKKLKEIEIEVEQINIRCNDQLKGIYDNAIKKSKVIIISDMYLPRNIIEDILCRNGLNNYIKVYVSGEDKGNKATGILFEHVIKDLKCKNILHIGDNFKGDYLIPKIKGIESKYIKSYKHPYFNHKSKLTLADCLITGLCDSKNIAEDSIWKWTGYSILGPFLLGYVSWIYSKAIEDKVERLVFLARDGYIVKEAFELIYGGNIPIITDYLYVSRKSVLPIRIDESMEIRDFILNFKFRRIESIKTVLCRLGLETEEIQGVKDFLIKRKDLYAGKYDYIIEHFYDIIKQRMLFQKQYVTQYIKEICKNDKVAVVDVGWHGTIQDCIEECLKRSINGYYVGLEKDAGRNKEAYITNFDPNIIPYTRGVFETFFSAPHPSTQKYKKEDGKVNVCFGGEYSEETKKQISQIHLGAKEFITNYLDLCNLLEIDRNSITNGYLTDMFLEFCLDPRVEDAHAFGNIEFNDIKNRKLIDDTFSLKSFMNSDWKSGYAKEKIKLPIPFGRLFAILNKIRN